MTEVSKRNKSVMLWGVNKATPTMLKDVIKNPKITVEKKVKETKKKEKVTKGQRDTFDPTIEYTVKDIEFLEKELDNLNDAYESADFSRLEEPNIKTYYSIKKLDSLDDDEKEAILGKMIDKVESLIEILNDYKNDGVTGKGIDSDSDEEEVIKKIPIKTPKTTKKEVPKQATKARAEKGSEEAKAKMAKLTAIRQAKKAEKDIIINQEKAKKSQERDTRKKPYYYIGKPPSGFRPATEDEAVSNDKVGEYGEHVVDPVKYNMYEKYALLVTTNKTSSQVALTLRSLEKRIDNIFTDIDIINSKVTGARNSKELTKLSEYLDKKVAQNKDFKRTSEYKGIKAQIKTMSDSSYVKGIEDKLTHKEQELKDIKKIYRFYQKLYAKLTNSPLLPKKVFTKKIKEIVQTVSKPITTEIPKSRLEKLKEELDNLPKTKPTKKYHSFKNHKETIEIPARIFDEKMILTPKYAEKLHKKGILLHPQHYDEEHTNKYFYTQIKDVSPPGGRSKSTSVGKGIGTFDLQKLLKQSYKPQIDNVGDYMVDDELSNPTTQVYRNKNTDKIYVVHRGTKGARDWLNNFVYGMSPSLYKYTDRYKNAKAVQDKAIDKYKGYDIDVLGHSQGSKIAELASKDNKNVKNIITYNRPQGLIENLYSKPKNLYDVKTSFDPVSPLIPYQKGNTLVIPSTTYNPLTEHSPDAISRIEDQMIGQGLVNRKPDLLHHSIVQSVVFDRPIWTKPRAIRWLKENNLYHDDIDSKPTQIRFRQYNPEDFHNYHYISKPCKDKGIMLIIAMKNAQGGNVYRSQGQGFMINNVEHFSPNEALLKNTKLITGHVQDAIKEHKKLAKEAKTTLQRTKSMNKSSLKQSLKGTQSMKDRMAKLRARRKST